jgi:hypothetical protein
MFQKKTNLIILCTLFHFSFSTFAETQEQQQNCQFSPDGFGIQFQVNTNGDIEGSSSSNLQSIQKDKTSKKYSFTTRQGSEKRTDTLELIKVADDSGGFYYDAIIKPGLNPKMKSPVSISKNTFTFNNGQCKLISQVTRANENQKNSDLGFDRTFCSSLLSKWNAMNAQSDPQSCLKSIEKIGEWLKSQKNSYEQMDINLGLSENSKNAFSATSELAFKCKLGLRGVDTSTALRPFDESRLDLSKFKPVTNISTGTKLRSYDDIVREQARTAQQNQSTIPSTINKLRNFFNVK